MTRAIVGGGISYLLMAALLFGGAGTLDWPRAWAFLGLLTAFTVVFCLWLRRADPDLLRERTRSPLDRAQRPRDRQIVSAILLIFLAWFVFMGVDAKRLHWSRTDSLTAAIGAALITTTFFGQAWVLSVNRFATTRIRHQAERGQTVISSGPYAVVRHPMYALSVPLFIGAPLMLGSLWALVWAPVFIGLFAARAVSEEALLREHLTGYDAYASRVRARLFPGIW